MSKEVATTKASNPIDVVKHQFDARIEEFQAALPAHIPIERFRRVVITAISERPDLLRAPRAELFRACVKAAQDGLLPDGREGALVARPTRDGVSVTWQPMIAGIRKKVRNSGEIATWDVQAVYENDVFEYELGDEPFIRHRPALGDRGKLVAVYSIATLKSGEKSRDVMSVGEVERIRDRSDAWKAYKAGKIKSTPWATDFDEMAKKTVARRHSKVLPMSTDLDDLMRRDDDLYDFKGASDAEQKAEAPQRPRLAGKLDALAAPAQPAGEIDDIDPETGEIVEQKPPAKKDAEGDASAEDGDADDGALEERAAMILGDLDHAPKGIDADDPAQVIAYAAGLAAAEEGVSRRAVPPEYRAKGREAEAAAWQRGHDYATMAANEGED